MTHKLKLIHIPFDSNGMDGKMFFCSQASRLMNSPSPAESDFQNFREVVHYLFYIGRYIQEWAGPGRN